MQFIYLIDIFQDNYNIVHDHFETDSVNVMKTMTLVAKKQMQQELETRILVTRNNNTLDWLLCIISKYDWMNYF